MWKEVVMAVHPELVGAREEVQKACDLRRQFGPNLLAQALPGCLRSPEVGAPKTREAVTERAFGAEQKRDRVGLADRGAFVEVQVQGNLEVRSGARLGRGLAGSGAVDHEAGRIEDALIVTREDAPADSRRQAEVVRMNRQLHVTVRCFEA
jgi:hypothetical protein